MTPVTMGDTEMVLIGCPDGSVVQYSADCSHFEILHQCTECIVDIFQTGKNKKIWPFSGATNFFNMRFMIFPTDLSTELLP